MNTIVAWFFRSRRRSLGACGRCGLELELCGRCAGEHVRMACASCLQGAICLTHRGFWV
jgi:hypothetical protein